MTKETIGKYLNDPVLKQNLWVFDTLDSTNAEAKRRALGGAESGTVILAESQTAGRGRLGRTFDSPKGGGIYLSMILRPKGSLADAVALTVVAAVAVHRAVKTVTQKELQIKWVNDLYLNDKKVCGILAERVEDAIIIGVGINVSTTFQGELATIAGSLFPVEQPKIRPRLTAELMQQLFKLEAMLFDPAVMEEYRNYSMVLGKTVTILQEEPKQSYLAEAIGDRGELMLRDATGVLRIVTSGEVSIRPSTNTWNGKK